MRIPLNVAVAFVVFLCCATVPSVGAAQQITVTPPSCALGVLPADTGMTMDNSNLDVIARLGPTGTYGLGACRQPIELQCPANSTCDLTVRLTQAMPSNTKMSINWHHGSVTYNGSCRPYQAGDIVAVFGNGSHPGVTTTDAFLYRIRGDVGVCIATVPPGVAVWVQALRGAPPGLYTRTLVYTLTVVSTP